MKDIKDIKVVDQIEDYYCGYACIEMITGIEQSALRKDSFPVPISVSNIVSILTKNKIRSEEINHSFFSLDVKKDYCGIVVINYYGYYHSVVVKNESGFFEVLDPSRMFKIKTIDDLLRLDVVVSFLVFDCDSNSDNSADFFDSLDFQL
jgi:hypothetical protein